MSTRKDGGTPPAREYDDPDAFLAGALDVEAGLRDILVQSRHDELTERLDDVLDTSAGLANILGDEPEAATEDAALISRVNVAGRPVPAPARMAFRNDPLVEPLRRAFEATRYLKGLLGIIGSPALTSGHIPIDLVAADCRARDLVVDVGHALHRIAPYVGPDLLRGPLGQAETLAELVTCALEYGNPEVLVRGGAHRAVGKLLQWYAHAFQDLISHTLDQPPGLFGMVNTPESLDQFLNDFTKGDLRSILLTVADLDGVRWSPRRTRWPHTIDTADLRIRSEETPPGSGIFTVQPGPAAVPR